MTSELASFSDWTLALLPRLFLYPGGLWLLVMLLALHFARGGRKALSLQALSGELSRANLLSLAVAWAAVALSPMPGAGALPSPVDSLVLAALPALSLLLDLDARSQRVFLAAGAITVTLLLPAIEYGSLLVRAVGPTGLLVAVGLAVLCGLVALTWEGDRGLAGEVRWLAWFCLGVVPLWQLFFGENPWAVSAFVLVGVVALSLIRNVKFGTRNDQRGELRMADVALAMSWLLAMGALLWVLLAAA